jgi:hypothetical protein
MVSTVFQVTNGLQTLMAGYATVNPGVGNEVEMETKDGVRVREELGRKNGHPKVQGCVFKLVRSEGTRDLDSRPSSWNLASA